jgi:hypothetical protein
MITGNITLSSKPDPDDMSDGICSGCGKPCETVAIDESFDDAFGMVSDWGTGSDCCGEEVLPLPEEEE